MSLDEAWLHLHWLIRSHGVVKGIVPARSHCIIVSPSHALHHRVAKSCMCRQPAPHVRHIVPPFLPNHADLERSNLTSCPCTPIPTRCTLQQVQEDMLKLRDYQTIRDLRILPWSVFAITSMKSSDASYRAHPILLHIKASRVSPPRSWRRCVGLLYACGNLIS